jgi:hypothetical protein
MPQADAILGARTIVTDIPVKLSIKEQEAKREAERVARNADETNWEYVEVEETDLFGDQNNGVSINFVKYGPGKHFVNPEIAKELRRLLRQKTVAEMRILQPNQDEKMRRIMAKSQYGATDKV